MPFQEGHEYRHAAAVGLCSRTYLESSPGPHHQRKLVSEMLSRSTEVDARSDEGIGANPGRRVCFIEVPDFLQPSPLAMRQGPRIPPHPLQREKARSKANTDAVVSGLPQRSATGCMRSGRPTRCRVGPTTEPY